MKAETFSASNTQNPVAKTAGSVAYQEDGPIAPDCRGLNFYRIDSAFQALLGIHLPPELRAHLEPWLDRMGELAGGRLDELAEVADKNGPVLRVRDRHGRDEEWVEYHPAYREMERIAFGEFGMHAMGRRGGVLDWPEPLPATAKYAFQYLFSQAEFGLMCPISVTETSTFLIMKYGSEELQARLTPRLLSQDMETLWKSSQFMTEKTGGSDVGGIETIARQENGEWRLYGDKWFCSHVDADVSLILARPEGAPQGTAGLGLFAMPWRLDDGRRNAFRVVRLKEKLGSRSMASGEILLEGALAWPVGDLKRGLKQMLDQVNLSRLSHGVRAAGMMRRCLNESLRVAHHREAFGSRLVELPLMRRQLMRLMVPTEQALSMAFFTAAAMDAANGGDAVMADALRILTPLLKLRACRDNIRVATGAMEVRGGNGYIEDWVNPRLVRDAHLGVLWEGTSNINALDVITRAVRKSGAHRALTETLLERLSASSAVPPGLKGDLRDALAGASRLAGEVANDPGKEHLARQAASGLYHAASAAILAWEAARMAESGGDARRLLLARMVLDHKLRPTDPLAAPDDAWEAEAISILLGDGPVTMAQAAALVERG